MEQVILFIITYILVFLIYKVYLKAKYKSKKKKKELTEVLYLVNKYHLDVKKIGYKKLLNVVCIVSSLDISILITIAVIKDKLFYQMLIAVILAIPLIVVSYSIVGNYYKKKGMIKDE